MPIYEYQCQECEKVFTVALSLSEKSSVKVQCPGCNTKNVRQLISPFQVKTESKT